MGEATNDNTTYNNPTAKDKTRHGSNNAYCQEARATVQRLSVYSKAAGSGATENTEAKKKKKRKEGGVKKKKKDNSIWIGGTGGRNKQQQQQQQTKQIDTLS